MNKSMYISHNVQQIVGPYVILDYICRCERAQQGPSFRGTVKKFCRERGHGFIQPAEGGEPLFCHISE